MQDAWWYATGGTRKGPVGFDFIREKVLGGEILPSDVVWKEGMAAWTPISDVPDLQPIIQALPPELPKTIEPPPLPSVPVPVPVSAPALAAGPWRRFFARSIDFWAITPPVVLLMVLGGLQVSSDFASWLQEPRSTWVIGFFAVPLVLAVEAMLFWMFGSTVGKALLGISVRTESSRQLTLTESFQRQMGVYVYGLGAGVPLINLVTTVRQYRRLKSGLQASYDEDRFVVTAVRLGVLRYVFVVAVLVLISLANGLLQNLSAKSHRGGTDSTVTPAAQSGEVFTASANWPEMVVIPAGGFKMGSNEDDREKPVHSVYIRSFELGKYEVTQGQWKAVMGSNPSYFQNCGDNCPVEQVSWDDIQQYIQKLNRMTGQQYRLPSEAEWEYAARAGTSSKYWWGDTASHEYANYGKNDCCGGLTQGRDKWENIAAPVGQFPANGFGLYDMQGNVWEWMQDVWHDNYAGAPIDGSAWTTGRDSSRRVLRGGSWGDDPGNLRSAFRFWNFPDDRGSLIGFRIARTVP
jgi:formylglycine-generating enzyme required for sulfatase activity